MRHSASLPPPNDGCAPQATCWNVLYVAERGVLVPPVAADEPVIARRARRGSPRCRRRSSPRRYVPVGVAPSPSRLCVESPLRPSQRAPRPGDVPPAAAAALPELERRPSSRRTRSRCTVTSCVADCVPGSRLTTPGHGAVSAAAQVAAIASTLTALWLRSRATLPPFVAQGRARDRGRPPLVVASGLPGRPVAAAPRPPALRRLRRQVARRHDHRERARDEPGDAPSSGRSTARASRSGTMLPIDVFHGSDSRSTAADNTSSFNCRFAVAPGPKHWSMHAYGEAIDVNTVENPYIQSGVVSPANAKAYADRTNVRPGMAVEGGVLVRAFARAGWGWGGRWSPLARLPALLDERPLARWFAAAGCGSRRRRSTPPTREQHARRSASRGGTPASRDGRCLPRPRRRSRRSR